MKPCTYRHSISGRHCPRDGIVTILYGDEPRRLCILHAVYVIQSDPTWIALAARPLVQEAS
jgi:hypothetical protein